MIPDDGWTVMDSAVSSVTETLFEVTVGGLACPLEVPVSVNTTYIPVSPLKNVALAVCPVPESPDIAPLESYHCHE